MVRFNAPRRLILACAAALIATASPAMAGRYVFTEITLPGEITAQAQAINDLDQVAGSFYGPNGYLGFTWSRGVARATQGYYTFGGINNRGIAGATAQTYPEYTAAYYDIRSQTFTPIRVDPKVDVSIAGINASNMVVGTGVYERGDEYRSIGFVSSGRKPTLLEYPGSTFTAPQAINDSGLVVGTYLDSARIGHGFTYQNGSFGTFAVPGETDIEVTALSASGAIAGIYTTSSAQHAFILSGNTVTTYDFPGSTYTSIVGFGPNGLLAGNFSDKKTGYGSFVYSGGTYYPIEAAAGAKTVVVGVNALGSLAGYYYKGDGSVTHAFIATCSPHHAPCTR